MRLGLVLLTVAIALSLPSWAPALPGDPPIVPLSPAEGATVAGDRNGIPVSFQCPAYRISFGESAPSGDSGDYSVRFSAAPALGPDGRLATQTYGSDAGASTASAGTCAAKLDTYDSARSPETVGGRVFWQAYRSCRGCETGWETGPVASFTIRPAITGTLSPPDRAYAGYPAVFAFESPVALSGAQLLLQRRGATSWLTVVNAPYRQKTELVATLPAGRQRLRVRIETAAGNVDLPERTMDVRRDGRRATSARDDGRYAARIRKPNTTLKLTVAGNGRTLRDFKASLTAFCVGPTIATNRFVVAFASLGSARIAPDGSVVGLLKTSTGARVLLTGRLRNRRFRGEVTMEFSTCSGSTKVDAVRR